MTLYKTIATADGGCEHVEMSPEEEAAIRAEWAEHAAAKQSWPPGAIVRALRRMGVSQAILNHVDGETLALFYTAVAVPEDDPNLLAALQAVDKTIDDLKAALAQ